jgi:hypothetical protein
VKKPAKKAQSTVSAKANGTWASAWTHWVRSQGKLQGLKIEAFILIFYIISRFGTISDRARGLLEGYHADTTHVNGCQTVKGTTRHGERKGPPECSRKYQTRREERAARLLKGYQTRGEKRLPDG